MTKPDTITLPAPIHGEIQAAFNVHFAPSSTGRKLVVQPSTQDSKITFVPAPGSGLAGLSAPLGCTGGGYREGRRSGLTHWSFDANPAGAESMAR